ncbi:MAG: DUF4325 domain-containing protein [Chloroflexota bacterium]
MNKHFKLSDFAVTYSTRTKADEIAACLKTYIKTVNNDDTLVIDFSGVEAISYSFLDQFISDICQLSVMKEKRLSLAGWSDSILPVIDKSLQHRSCNYSKSVNDERILVSLQ